MPPVPALATQFEMQVRQLQLTARMYTSSRELRAWCEENREEERLRTESEHCTKSGH